MFELKVTFLKPLYPNNSSAFSKDQGMNYEDHFGIFLIRRRRSRLKTRNDKCNRRIQTIKRIISTINQTSPFVASVMFMSREK